MKYIAFLVILISLMLSGCTYHEPNLKEVRYYTVSFTQDTHTGKYFKTERWNEHWSIFTVHTTTSEILYEDIPKGLHFTQMK